ncbi:MAG: site-2 protease family protein, partial [Methanomassiliicoccales archaeon]|nr:site-2 protease family protein [Methanomassiliicoccales archaeon]
PFNGRDTVDQKLYGLLSFVGNAFGGYSPVPEATHWWYDSNILPDDVFWVVMSLIFWIFWLNLVLGITNALPAVPFDGGFLFMGGLSFILEKFGMKDDEKRESLVERIGTAVTYVTLAMVVLVILVMVI